MKGYRGFAVPALLLAGTIAGLISLVLYQRWSSSDASIATVATASSTTPRDSARVVAGRLWYVGDGYLAATSDGRLTRADGAPVDRSSALHLLNPGAVSARVRVIVYRTSAAPTSFVVDLPPGALDTLDLTRRREIPRGEIFWIAVDADQPVFPQLEHADHRPWDPVPDTLEMVMPQPGPLDETAREWVFPDGFQGGTESWVETETISLLNPGATPGRVQLTFLFHDGRPRRLHDVTVAPARAVAVDLWRLFPPIDESGPPIVSGDFVTLVTADVPVVSQQTRRARWRGSNGVVGSRTVAPIRVSESRRARTWYYAGGWIRPLDVLPRDKHDHTWQLLFSYGLAPQDVEVQPFTRRGPGTPETIALAPLRSDLQWLHADPWRERLGVNEPWALVLKSAGPVAASVLAAEYEPWSQGIPGAMSAAPLVPEPLASEWWLGITRQGGSDDQPAAWAGAWQLFNPGSTPVRVTLRFHGVAPAPESKVIVVNAGGVVRVSGDSVPGLPAGQPVVVSASGDGPFVAHAWLRVGPRGVPVTRALASAPGLPILRGDARTAGAPAPVSAAPARSR